MTFNSELGIRNAELIVSPYGQRDAGPGHDSLAPLAYSPGETYSAFANGTDEITFLPQTKKGHSADP